MSSNDKPKNIEDKFEDKAVFIESVAAKRAKDLLNMTRHFFRLEASGGIVLMLASAFALIAVNGGFYGVYNYVLNEVDFRIGLSDPQGLDFELKKSLLLWINDGLMAVFFFLIGLEVKREIVEGELSSRERVLLPAIAAIGGMLVPALVFYGFNKDIPDNLSGWAIPAATDIAFALGLLSLLGSRVPVSLKVFLTSVAIIDDILAILIIAIFYSHKIYIEPLYVAGITLIVLFAINKKNVPNLTPYILGAIVLWVAVLESGIHATLAGVLAALFVPMKADDSDYSPCKSLEHSLHPWVAFGVLPIFGFANAGVSFAGMGIDSVLNPVTLGIACGLFFGKQIGIFLLMFLTIITGLSPKPDGSNWGQLYAVSALCGVGFTMSLFIGGLAYADYDMQVSVRLGVLIGSILSAALAMYVMHLSCPKEKEPSLS
jgi:NhaA family Na+:H+ antiporter